MNSVKTFEEYSIVPNLDVWPHSDYVLVTIKEIHVVNWSQQLCIERVISAACQHFKRNVNAKYCFNFDT